MPLAERAQTGLHDHVVDRVRRLALPGTAEILDIGCGTGALLHRLQGLGYQRLTGLDIAPPEAPEGFRALQVDLDDCRAPLPDGCIDLALMVEVIEHVENVGSLLDEIHRLLRPDGSVLITTPNVHSLEARIRWLLTGQLKQFDAIGDPTHLYPVFEFPFRRVLARHRFSVQSSWGFPTDGSSPTSRGGLRALAALGRLAGLRGRPAGDQWCLLLRRESVGSHDRAQDKRRQVTSHY